MQTINTMGDGESYTYQIDTNAIRSRYTIIMICHKVGFFKTENF